MKVFSIFFFIFLPQIAVSQTHTTGGGPDYEKNDLFIYCDYLVGAIKHTENEFMLMSKKKVINSSSFPNYIEALLIEKSLTNINPPKFSPSCGCNEERRLELLIKIRDYYAKKLSPSMLPCVEIPERVKLIKTLDSLIKVYKEK